MTISAMMLENCAATILNGIDNATERDLRMLRKACEHTRMSVETKDPMLQGACESACQLDFTEEEANRIVQLLSSLDDLIDACRNTEADPDVRDRVAAFIGHWSSRLAISGQYAA